MYVLVQIVVDVVEYLDHPFIGILGLCYRSGVLPKELGKQLKQYAVAFEVVLEFEIGIFAVDGEQFGLVVVGFRVGVGNVAVRVQLEETFHQAFVQLCGTYLVLDVGIFEEVFPLNQLVEETDVVVAHVFYAFVGMEGELGDDEHVALAEFVFFPVHVDTGRTLVYEVQAGERTDDVAVTPFLTDFAMAGINHVEGERISVVGVFHANLAFGIAGSKFRYIFMNYVGFCKVLAYFLFFLLF